MGEETGKFKNLGYISIDGFNFEPIDTTVEARFEDADPGFFKWIFGHKTTDIDRVIFNDPATIVFWKDKTKTVVKCHPEDTFDEEIGFMCCYLKRILSSKEYTKFCGYLNDIWAHKQERQSKERTAKQKFVDKPICQCDKNH